MRRSQFLRAGIALALSAAAWGAVAAPASPDAKPKRQVASPPSASSSSGSSGAASGAGIPTAAPANGAPTLRGPLDASAPAPAFADPAPTSIYLPRVGQAYVGLSLTGTALPPITPLPNRTDPAPICRETCAENRLACLANEGDCDTPWAVCVADCSAPQPASAS